MMCAFISGAVRPQSRQDVDGMDDIGCDQLSVFSRGGTRYCGWRLPTRVAAYRPLQVATGSARAALAASLNTRDDRAGHDECKREWAGGASLMTYVADMACVRAARD